MNVVFTLFNWKRCTECGKRFILSEPKQCVLCKKILCSSCIGELEDRYPFYLWSLGDKPNIDYYGKLLCKSCVIKLEQSPENTCFCERYEAALLEHGKIKVFPSSYHGKLKIDASVPPKKLVSRLVPDRSIIEKAFQVSAIMLGYDLVYDVFYNKETAWDGNYQYKVYQGVGIAAKKLASN